MSSSSPSSSPVVAREETLPVADANGLLGREEEDGVQTELSTPPAVAAALSLLQSPSFVPNNQEDALEAQELLGVSHTVAGVVAMKARDFTTAKRHFDIAEYLASERGRGGMGRDDFSDMCGTCSDQVVAQQMIAMTMTMEKSHGGIRREISNEGPDVNSIVRPLRADITSPYYGAMKKSIYAANRAYAPNSTLLASLYVNATALLVRNKQHEEAVDLARTGLERMEKVASPRWLALRSLSCDPTHPQAALLLNLGMALHRDGREREAIQVLHQSRDVHRKWVVLDPPSPLFSSDYANDEELDTLMIPTLNGEGMNEEEGEEKRKTWEKEWRKREVPRLEEIEEEMNEVGPRSKRVTGEGGGPEYIDSGGEVPVPPVCWSLGSGVLDILLPSR